MAEDKDIEKKIKETFDGLHKKAPENLWNSLSDKLPFSDSNKDLETKIKAVFENIDKSAPPHIWDVVNKQLNIDKVWERINAELDRRPVLYRRKIANLAFLFLILILGGLYLNNWRILPFYSNDMSVAAHESHKNELATPFDNVEKNKNHIAERNETIGKSSNSKVHESRKNSLDNSHQKTLKQKEITKGRSEAVDRVLRLNESNMLTGAINKNVNKSIKKSVNPEHINLNKESSVNASETKENKLIADNDSLYTAAILPLKTTRLVNDDNDKELILNSQNYGIGDTANIQSSISSKKKRFEIGLTYSYNNTWIINNETQKSFDENSLIQTSAAFACSYGLVANYNFSKLSAISMDLYYNSKIRQQYNMFTEGLYANRDIEFNYTKLVLSYQLNIDQPYIKKTPSRYTLKIGGYGAYLKSYTDAYNKTVAAENNEYASIDYGVKLAIGQEKILNRIIIGYGANTEFGLNNNFKGNKRMPAGFNNTKNSLIGLYLNLKYSL